MTSNPKPEKPSEITNSATEYEIEESQKNITTILHFLSDLTIEEFWTMPEKEIIHLHDLFLSCQNDNFEKFFLDEAIIGYRDKDDSPIHGGRSLSYWRNINQASNEEILARQRYYLRYHVIPLCVEKAILMHNSKSYLKKVSKRRACWLPSAMTSGTWRIVVDCQKFKEIRKLIKIPQLVP